VTTERITSPPHASTASLVNEAAGQISTLVHDELTLAKLEMQTKAKQMGLGSALLGGALLLSRVGLLLGWALLVVALANVWPLWLAVFVPMVAAFAVAGLLALLGKARLKRAVPPVPTQATDSVATDLRAARDALHDGRQS
jgi:hypothetical protein